jgi:hypothetical protein
MAANREQCTAPKAKPTRLPILLSAFVMPGAGQFMQRRWLAAWFYCLGFLFTFVMFALYLVKILTAYYSMWLRFETYQAGPVPFKAVIGWFLLAMAIYAAGVIDTYVAHMRANSRAAADNALSAAGASAPPKDRP